MVPFWYLSLSSYSLCEENEQGIFDAILHGHIDFASEPWPKISSNAKDLIKKMLRADPKERLSAVEALSKFYSSCKCKLISFYNKRVLCCILTMLTLRISQALLIKWLSNRINRDLILRIDAKVKGRWDNWQEIGY